MADAGGPGVVKGAYSSVVMLDIDVKSRKLTVNDDDLPLFVGML